MGSIGFPIASQMGGNIAQVEQQMSAAAMRQRREATLVSNIIKLDRHGLAAECARLSLPISDTSVEGLRGVLFAHLRAQRQA